MMNDPHMCDLLNPPLESAEQSREELARPS
jgi:hypothetical protein